MGKGNRNRESRNQTRLDAPLTHTSKNKKNQGAPKWLLPLISLALVVLIVGGLVLSTLADSGVFKRGNVLIKSQTGKFDMTQQMATYIAWEGMYYQAYTYWYYVSMGYVQDTTELTSRYTSGDDYALAVASSNVQGSLRDCIDDIAQDLLGYVAIADEAYRQGYRLTEEELAEVDTSVSNLKKLQEDSGFPTLNAFLDNAIVKGMRKRDVRRALETVLLYNKYCEAKQLEFKSALTPEDLVKYRDENPGSFYSTDYLTYATEDKAFADYLKGISSPEDFKNAVGYRYFNDNYKTIFNKYTVTATATEKLNELTGKVDGEEADKKALTEALDKIGAGPAKEYEKPAEDAESTVDSKLTDWLFSASRKQYESTSILTDDAVYVLAIMEIDNESTPKKVTVRELVLPLEDGESYGDDATFMETLRKHYRINLELLEDEEFKMEVYKSADEKAEGFKKTLVDAEGKVVNDAAARLKAAGATVVADVKKTTSTVPEKVRDSVFTAGVTKNSLLKVAVGDAMYIVWVEDCSTGDIPTEADLQYVSFENDVYYKILNDLVTGAEKLIPADKTAAYTDKPAENSVEAWLFASIKNFTSAVEEGDTRVIETKKSESGEEITTYNVYLVLANPMHIDTELYVNGGYLSFTKEDSTAAQALAESLAGKTGEDLKTALSTKSTSAVTSESISPASVTDENLKAWLFSADRKANDYTVLDNAAGTSKYVAVYLGSEEAWKLSAISGATSARVTEHVAGFTANYTVRERALARVGQPTPETTTTTSAS